METLVGTIHKVVYESDTNDFKVFRLRRKDKLVLTVSGEFPALLIGAKVEVHGDYHTHPKYGVGFKATAYSFGYESDAKSICLYIQSIAKWIGPERSWALAQHFGDKIANVIENTPDLLQEVEGVGPKVAQSLIEAWNLNHDLKDIQIFLHGLGLSHLKIKKLISMYGQDTEVILKENPWLLCFRGFGFSTCDYIAQKLEKDPTNPLRWQYFILHCLKDSLMAGHLYLLPEQLVLLFNKFNHTSNYQFKAGGDITIDDFKDHIKALLDEGFIVIDENRIYELWSFFYESESARIMKKVMETKDTCKFVKEDVETFITKYENQHKIKLSDEQRDAIRSFITEKAMVITGSPGTGKTTLVKALVQIMKENNISFELLTPTGIAAKKLGNTAGCDAYTIHRRLGYKGDEWDYGAFVKYNTQVVICDEVSMVDQEVFYRLVSALYPSTKLVFVGDVDQLPSVGPGCVLRELIDSKVLKVIALNTIFRQEECSDIIKEAKKIKEGDIDMSLFKRDKMADIWHIPEKDHDKVEQIIIKIAQQMKDSNSKLAPEDRKPFQIITPRNQGPASVYSLNTALQQVLNPPSPDKKDVRVNDYTIRKGDRVIIKKNNYELGVFNGDIGKVAHITTDYVVIDIDDIGNETRRVEIPLKVADEMVRLAYTITVHGCLPVENRITTQGGLIQLKSLSEKNTVISGAGNKKEISWKGNTGSHKIVEIKTRCGYVSQSSLDHEFLVSTDNGTFYKKAKDIKIGDYANIYRKEIQGSDTPIIFSNRKSRGNGKIKKIKLPKFLNKELSWLFGAIIGDGCYTDKDDGLVDLTCPEDQNLLNKFEKIIKRLGLNVFIHYRKNNIKFKGIPYSKYTCSKNFREWLYSIGLKYVTGYHKIIPDIMFTTTKENRIAFLEGLLDSDGCVDLKPQIRYTTSSSKLARDIQLLLLSLGVISRISKSKNIFGTVMCIISVSGIDYTILKNTLNLNNKKRNTRLKKYCTSIRDKSNIYEIPYKNDYVEKFIRLYKNNEGKSQGIKGKGMSVKYKYLFSSLQNILSGNNKLRYSILREMLRVSKLEGFILPKDIQNVINKNIFFDKIVKIKVRKTKEKMQDIEVKDDHSYISNGFICHNSQGMEYPLVVLAFLKAHGDLLLQRNLLYTAITRAKKKVIIVGQSSAIEKAIMNDKIQKRNTLFAKRIKEWMIGQGTSLRNMFSEPSKFQNVQNIERLLSLEAKVFSDQA